MPATPTPVQQYPVARTAKKPANSNRCAVSASAVAPPEPRSTRQSASCYHSRRFGLPGEHPCHTPTSPSSAPRSTSGRAARRRYGPFGPCAWPVWTHGWHRSGTWSKTWAMFPWNSRGLPEGDQRASTSSRSSPPVMRLLCAWTMRSRAAVSPWCWRRPLRGGRHRQRRGAPFRAANQTHRIDLAGCPRRHEYAGDQSQRAISMACRWPVSWGWSRGLGRPRRFRPKIARKTPSSVGLRDVDRMESRTCRSPASAPSPCATLMSAPARRHGRRHGHGFGRHRGLPCLVYMDLWTLRMPWRGHTRARRATYREGIGYGNDLRFAAAWFPWSG